MCGIMPLNLIICNKSYMYKEVIIVDLLLKSLKSGR